MQTTKVARLTLIEVSIIFISLILTGISYARIDPGTYVGIWFFDEGKGNVAKDASGNGHDGEILGDVKWVEGSFGKALQFPGQKDSYVSIPYDEELSLTTWCISVWIRIEKIESQEVHVVVKENKSGAKRNYGIIAQQSKFAYLTFTSGEANWKNVAGTTPVDDGVWHHVAATYDKSFAGIFLDGTLETEKQRTAAPDTTTDILGIGAGSGGRAPVKGIIDEVAVFNVALEKDDIQKIMNEGLKEATGIYLVESEGNLSTTWGWIKEE